MLTDENSEVKSEVSSAYKIEKPKEINVLELQRLKQIDKCKDYTKKLIKCNICSNTTKLIKFHKKSKDETYICNECSPSYTSRLFKKINPDLKQNMKTLRIFEGLLRNSLDASLKPIVK